MSKITVKQIKCPCCGSSLSLKDEGYGETKCSYCNAIVFVSREDTNEKGDMNIYNIGDNKPLGKINIPLGWDITNTFIDYNRSTLQKPYAFGFDLSNNMGSEIFVESGPSYFIQGPVLTRNEQIPYTFQKEFETVDKFIDELADAYAKVENKKVKFIEELDLPVEKFNKKKAFEKTKSYYENICRNEEMKAGSKMSILGIYGESSCRVYEMGKDALVIYTRVIGRHGSYMLGGISNIGAGISNLMSGIGNMISNTTSNNNGGNILNKMADKGLLGGMLGKKLKTNNQEEVKVEPKEEIKVEPKEESSDSMFGNMKHPGQMEFLEWQTTPVFMLITSKDNYKEIYKKAFKQICSSYEVSREILTEYDNLKNQMENNINQNNQARAQAEYQHGQSLINMGAQRMAANQSYVESMMARSNRQYESQRSSYNSRMEAQDRMRDKRTEAILGVNTFIKPDGKEVEVPVSADTAWINGKGEIIGGSAGFDPGSGWTKMDKKY